MNVCLIGGGKKDGLIDESLTRISEGNVLIIPSSCSIESGFIRKTEAITQFFRERGLRTSLLHGFNQTASETELEHKFGEAGMVYIVGGNSPAMLRAFDQMQIDRLLRRHVVEDAKLLSGTSAGALALFAEALICPVTDHHKEGWEFEKVKMLGYIKAFATAHADVVEPTKNITRWQALLQTRDNQLSSVGIDNNAALVIHDDQGHVVTSSPASRVRLILRGTDEYIELGDKDKFEISSI